MKMPNIILYPLEEAKKILESCGFEIAKITETWAPAKRGKGSLARVVRQRQINDKEIELVVAFEEAEMGRKNS